MAVAISFPVVPADLKLLTPYIQRAQELREKDPVIAYYCLFYTIQTGLSVMSKSKENNAFLTDLMTTLEQLKEELRLRKEITSDAVAATYIESFAVKVFNKADNEDRRGGSNRGTAKTFLAAANFFELLRLFEKYHNDELQVDEKIKYCKWKAADIAKAFREGRAPQPGPPEGTIDGPFSVADRTETPPSDIDDGSVLTSATGQRGLLPPGSPTKLNAPSGLPKTPLRSPGPSDGIWSNVATPGLEGPTRHVPGRSQPSSLSSATLAFFNNSYNSKGDSSKSVNNRATGGQDDTGGDTDPEDDGQWSTVGNNAISRQGSLVPHLQPPPHPSLSLPVFELGSVPEEATSAKGAATPNYLMTPNALGIPLPSSAGGSVTSSPAKQPDVVIRASPSPETTPDTPSKRGHHIRSQSAQDATPKETRPPRPISQGGPIGDPRLLSTNHGQTASGSETKKTTDADWENASIGRRTRLPESVTGSSDAESAESDPSILRPLNESKDSFNSGVTTRRNTIRQDGPSIGPPPRNNAPSPITPTTHNFILPGVPSNPPGSGGRPGSSDSDDGGDLMARLPSAPPLPPSEQDKLPHIAVIPRSRLDPHEQNHEQHPADGLNGWNRHLPPPPPNHLHSHGTSLSSNSPPANEYTYPQGNPNAPHHHHSVSTSSIPINYQPPASAHPGYSSHSSSSFPTPDSANTSISLPPGNGFQHYPPPPPPTQHHYTSSVSSISDSGGPASHHNVHGHQYAQQYNNTRWEAPAVQENGRRSPPATLDPESIGKAQKHAKFAISALNFEDLETAREELRKALKVLG